MGCNCSTVVECAPRKLVVLGSNPAGSWAFFFIFLSFPTFGHQWRVLNQVPQGGASLTVCCECRLKMDAKLCGLRQNRLNKPQLGLKKEWASPSLINRFDSFSFVCVNQRWRMFCVLTVTQNFASKILLASVSMKGVNKAVSFDWCRNFCPTVLLNFTPSMMTLELVLSFFYYIQHSLYNILADQFFAS